MPRRTRITLISVLMLVAALWLLSSEDDTAAVAEGTRAVAGAHAVSAADSIPGEAGGRAGLLVAGSGTAGPSHGDGARVAHDRLVRRWR